MKVTGLIDHIVFGPVESRRYGRSLGVNPLPRDLKLCNFNCPYCECGWTDVAESRSPVPSFFPSVSEIEGALRAVLEGVRQSGRPIDNITVCGNGEPTMHPEFPLLVERLVKLREELAENAGLNILANSTNLHRPQIVAALSRLDEQIMKLDAGTQDLFRKMAMPLTPVTAVASLTVDEICEGIRKLPRVVIQSMFVEGRLCNTREEEVSAWLSRIRHIQPLHVQVYSLDRAPADCRLRRVSGNTLHKIANRVEKEAGVRGEVFV